VPSARERAGRLRTSMANIKSQIKRNRQNEKRGERNKTVRTALKTSTKKVRTAVAAGDADEAMARQLETARALDKAVAKGIVHKRTAARRKSRLAKAASSVTSSE
jgi:small subunit ribosomal protein S20